MTYEIPPWLGERALEALGGREHVIELMSGPRLTFTENPVVALAQRDLEGKLAILKRVHDRCEEITPEDLDGPWLER